MNAGDCANGGARVVNVASNIGLGTSSRPGRLPRRGAPMGRALVALCWWILAASLGAAADDPPSPAAVKSLLDTVREEVAAERPTAARGALEQAAAAIAALAAEDKPPAGLRALVERARGLRDELALQGVDVEAIEIHPIGGRLAGGKAGDGGAEAKPPARRPASGSSAGKSPGGSAGKSPGGSAERAAGAKTRGLTATKGEKPGGAAGGVSFVKQVAPLLLRHCGGCHVAGKRGDFQFSSYETLLKTGMVQKGAGTDSRLVEVIRTGDMPRGGGKVSAEECAVLVKWIDEGASFDGEDPVAGLQGAAAPPTGAPAAIPAGPVKLGPGEVSFAFDVAPVLVKQCSGCHDAMQPDGNLSMVSLETLLRGGANGSPAIAGEGAASLLIRKLKGVDIDGQRMPLGKTPVSDDVIEKIEKWIDQGTKLDLLSPQSPLETVAAAGRARTLSHEDLLAARFDAADAVWRRAIADEEPVVVTRGDLRVVGNLPESRLGALADAAEKAMDEAADQLGLAGAPLAKGGVVVLAFDKPYDYSAFWENVLGDDRPKGLTGRAGISGDVVFCAFVAPSLDSAADRADAQATLSEELVAAAFLARGTPDWFAAAAGRSIAQKVSPKSPLAKGWRAEGIERLNAIRRPLAVVEGSASPSDTANVGGVFLAAVSGGGARLKSLVTQLDSGSPFEAAFATVYQGSPAAVFEAWLSKEGKKRSGNAGR